MSAFLLIKVNLVSLFLESLLYGIFVLLFCIVLSIAFGPADGHFVNQKRIIWISTVMVLMSTSHLALNLARTLQIFDLSQSDEIEGLLRSLQTEKDAFSMVKTMLYIAQTILGDGVLVWRCFIVYDRSKWVLFPGILILLVDMVILLTYRVFIQILNEVESRPNSQLPITFIVLTILLHASYTGAMVWKLYQTRHLAKAARSLAPVGIAILESGAIYSVAVMVLLAFSAVNSGWQYMVMDAITPLVGIVFCLIVLQIHIYLSKGNYKVNNGLSSNLSIPWKGRTEGNNDGHDHADAGHKIDVVLDIKKEAVGAPNK